MESISAFIPERTTVEFKNRWDPIQWKKESGFVGDLGATMNVTNDLWRFKKKLKDRR
jgi:hypothetical protein